MFLYMSRGGLHNIMILCMCLCIGVHCVHVVYVQTVCIISTVCRETVCISVFYTYTLECVYSLYMYMCLLFIYVHLV